MVDGIKVAHIYKRSYTDERHHFLGATKDIRSRTQFFEDCSIDCQTFTSASKENLHLNKLFTRRWLLEGMDAILLETTLSPQALIQLRELHPSARILVRSHNAEFLHRIDWVRAKPFSRKVYSYLRQAMVNGRKDWQTAQVADRILPISPWEAKHYWSRLTSSDKIVYTPFFFLIIMWPICLPESKRSGCAFR